MSLMLNDTIFLKTLQLFAQTNQTSRRRGGLVIAKNLCTRSSQCTAVRSVHRPHYLIMTAVQPRGRARQAWLGNPTKNTGLCRVYKYQSCLLFKLHFKTIDLNFYKTCNFKKMRILHSSHLKWLLFIHQRTKILKNYQYILTP